MRTLLSVWENFFDLNFAHNFENLLPFGWFSSAEFPIHFIYFFF
ncbi:unnamed protein product [Meloidogyne enterolobii]|uniref:Uncharacterized protein n=1 Tax=Meloidogyne enterolobii TaxID=390850 RepID=A0ACB0XU97_MELEN